MSRSGLQLIGKYSAMNTVWIGRQCFAKFGLKFRLAKMLDEFRHDVKGLTVIKVEWRFTMINRISRVD